MPTGYEAKGRSDGSLPRPIFVTLLIFCLGGNAAAFTLMAMADLLGAILGLNLVQHHADGDPVSRAEFYAAYGPQLAGLIAWAGCAAFLLWRRHPLARHLIVGAVLFGFALSLPQIALAPPLDLAILAAESVAAIALALWYFYKKQSVRAYFASSLGNTIPREGAA